MNINVNLISNHENNPRKEYGDLSELRDSIAKNGILQPLTVVPCEGGYKVVIGHRRLEAAKQAGLEEVPCEVKELTESEQLNMMMMENMMREALTTYEEAKGFQLMLDLGKSVEDVSNETGFSQTTIRNRTKLLGLDEKKFKKSVERGATLSDLVKLNDIEDPHMRNAVLTHAGTPEFYSRLNRAIEEEHCQKKMMQAEAAISQWATKITGLGELNGDVNAKYYASFSKHSDGKFPEPDTERRYFYTKDDWHITVYAEGDPDQEAEEKRIREERRMIEKALEDRAKSAYNLRTEFIKNFGNFRKYGKIIQTEFLKAVLEDMERTSWRSIDLTNLKKMLDVQEIKVEDYPAEKMMLLMLSVYNDSPMAKTWYQAWNGTDVILKYEPNDKLLKFYSFLLSIGYQPSKEEVDFCNGDIDYVIKEETA